MFKRTSRRHRLTALVKAAAIIVLLGLAMLAIDSPRLISGGADAAAKVGATQTGRGPTGQPPSSGFEYFPAQFPAPAGEIEPLAPQF